MKAAKDSRSSDDVLRPSHLLGRNRPPLDEARQQVAFGLHEADDLGPDSQLGRNERGAVLDDPVDGEQLRVLTPDPEDADLAVDRNLEVLVGQTAAQGLEDELAARPDALGNLLRLHPAILDWGPWPHVR